MKLGGAKDHTAQKYLGVLMLFGKYGEQDVESESRKQTILNGLFRGVLIWSKLASERDLLLSTISWDCFSEPVWQDRKSTRLNSSHGAKSRMPSSA